MTTKCIHCGHENDEALLRCVCGNELPGAPAAGAASIEALRPTSPAAAGPNLGWMKVLFAVWAIGLVPLFTLLRSFVHVSAVNRSLIGTAVYGASVAAAFWLFGQDRRRMLWLWRLVFMLWALLLTPMILTIAEGLAEQGWPSGKFNRPIARLLVVVLTLTIPAYLTGLCATIRAYRLAGVLAIVTGLASVVGGIFLIRATEPFLHRSIVLVDVLDLVMFGSKVDTYLSIPIGILLLVGGILTLRTLVRS